MNHKAHIFRALLNRPTKTACPMWGSGQMIAGVRNFVKIYTIIYNAYKILIIAAMNEINWNPKALKQIEKIKDSKARKRVYTESQALSDFPHCQGVKKLVNHEYSYRLRAGNYRVFFEFDGDAHIINIEEVKKRDESTY